MFPLEVFLSHIGTIAQRRIPIPNNTIPTSSPGRKRISPGRNLKTWNIKRKYHSGLIPTGADAKGSAFVPSSHGKNTARMARIFITINRSKVRALQS